MKAITEKELMEFFKSIYHNKFNQDEIFVMLKTRMKEIDTLTVSSLRPMVDAPGDINILVEHDFSNTMTESRAIPNEEIITSGGCVIKYTECDGWIPMPNYKPEKE